ncbi:hypothetical protein [Alloactinosynnema sp. L-07]|uniref:hypothetical protein n=1 Tax=Alloactinosynnema sp. L-07 TaxID=1653480 RepID=UPI00065F06CE|nr:hypothetical protein [Alloactinosynnema sp. L-07]CRK59289.1 hypothetical protein [Alloactinosynnema sp. L-07]
MAVPVAVYAVVPLVVVTAEAALGLGMDWRAAADGLLFVSVMLIVGILMDAAALAGVSVPSAGSRAGQQLERWGLTNAAALTTTAVTPVLAVLAVWNAFHGGDVSFPTVEPGQVVRDSGR